MECALCNVSISDGAQCSVCKKDIGFCCADTTEQSFRKLRGDRKAVWKCPKCKREALPAVAAVAKHTDASDTILNEIRDLRKELACLPGLVRDMATVKSELSEVKESCNFTSNKVEEFSARLAEMERKLPEVEALNSTVQSLTNEVSWLKEELARNDQLMRLNNVEIKGVPVKKNENLYNILDRICSEIDYGVDKNSINYISRVPIQNSKDKLIVVSFSNRYIKEDFIASARLKKSISAEDIGFQGVTHRVYVNDHLTPSNKKLLTSTKTQLKQKGYAYIWVKYSKIHVRKDDNSRVLTMNHERDLNKLL
ncbi:uncharacterized protein LOC134669382 [Cydia fagiglandana]|uniref:uncharacterized protein LOC134669382 n=1 Tax=Cydia fagiglandana TaxID=1458189 RepID=UPI002FEE4CD7